MSSVPQKVCRACGIAKPFADFNRDASKRDGVRGICRVCDNERSRTWRTSNLERARQQSRDYAQSHKQQSSERGRRWYEANKQLTITRAREWEQVNTEQAKEIKRESALRRVTNRRASRNAWKRRNPLHALTTKQARRARKAESGGAFTVQEWRELCAAFNNRCLCCGRDDVKLTADHVVPIALGGDSNISNIQPLCGTCNSSKGATIMDYRPRRCEAEGLTVERAE